MQNLSQSLFETGDFEPVLDSSDEPDRVDVSISALKKTTDEGWNRRKYKMTIVQQIVTQLAYRVSSRNKRANLPINLHHSVLEQNR